jgi:hypothetical protein
MSNYIDRINRCIAILSQLNNDTDQIFDIPKEQRTALIKAKVSFLDLIVMNLRQKRWCKKA